MFRFSKIFIVSKLMDYNWYKTVLERNIGCICEHISSPALLNNCVFKSCVQAPQHADVLCSSENIIVCGTVLWRKKYVSKYIVGKRQYHTQRKFGTKTTITDDTSNDKKSKTGNTSSKTPKKQHRTYIKSTPKIKSLDIATNSLAVNKRTKKHAIAEGIKIAEKINESKDVSELKDVYEPKKLNDSIESKQIAQDANEKVPNVSKENVEITDQETSKKSKEITENVKKNAPKEATEVAEGTLKATSKETKDIVEEIDENTSKVSKEIDEGALKAASTETKEIVEETDKKGPKEVKKISEAIGKTPSKELKVISDKKVSNEMGALSEDGTEKISREPKEISEDTNETLLKSEISDKKISKELKAYSATDNRKVSKDDGKKMTDMPAEVLENTEKRASKESKAIFKATDNKEKTTDNNIYLSKKFVESTDQTKVGENNEVKGQSAAAIVLNAPKVDEKKIETKESIELHEINKVEKVPLLDDITMAEKTSADRKTLILKESKFDMANDEIDKEGRESLKSSESEKTENITLTDSTIDKESNDNDAKRKEDNSTGTMEVIEMKKQANAAKIQKNADNPETSGKINKITKSIKKAKKNFDKAEKISEAIKKTLSKTLSKSKKTEEGEVAKKSLKIEDKSRNESNLRPSPAPSIDIEEQKEHISKADLPPRKVHIEYIESKNLKDVEITKSSTLGHNMKPKRRRRVSKRRQETTTDPMILKLIRRSQLSSENFKSFENKQTPITSSSFLTEPNPPIQNRETKKTSQKNTSNPNESGAVKAPEFDKTSKTSCKPTVELAFEADKTFSGNSSLSPESAAGKASETEKDSATNPSLTVETPEINKTVQTSSVLSPELSKENHSPADSEPNTNKKSETMPEYLKPGVKRSRISEISKMSYIESKMNPSLGIKFLEDKSLSNLDLKIGKSEDNKSKGTKEKKTPEKTDIDNLEDMGPSTSIYILATPETEKIIEEDTSKIIAKSDEGVRHKKDASIEIITSSQGEAKSSEKKSKLKKTPFSKLKVDDFIDEKLSLRSITEAEVEKKLKSKLATPPNQLYQNAAPIEGRSSTTDMQAFRTGTWEGETSKLEAEDASPTSSTISFKQKADLVPNADAIKWGAYLPPEATSVDTPKKPAPPTRLKDERVAAGETTNTSDSEHDIGYTGGSQKKTYIQIFTYTLWTMLGSAVVYFLADILSHDDINSKTPMLTINKYLSGFQARKLSHDTMDKPEKDKKNKKDKKKNKGSDTVEKVETGNTAKDEERLYSGDEGF
uniref:Uncharacterized protein n=1 Tax=Glossina pallidipes TaxID=7398 RepID=A0A1B0ABV4_GLOPL